MDREVQWANLPKELWRMISKFIDTRIDVVRVRAVCKSWRSSVSPPVISLKLPFSSKPSDGNISPPRGEYLPLVKRTIYRIQPCEQNPNPWTLFGSSSKGAFLFQVEEKEGAQGMRLLTPLSGNPIQPPSDPKGLNFLSSGLSEICTYYYYKSTTSFLSYFPLRKVVLSRSNPFTAYEDDEYAVMTMDYGTDQYEDVDGVLYFYKSGEKEWSWMNEASEGKLYWLYENENYANGFTDLITYKRKFYAIHVRGRTIVIDPCSKTVSDITPDIWECNHSLKQIHLVESLGHLLLVDRDSDRIDDDNAEMGYTNVDNFKVYKLDEAEGKWVEIKSLGDQALFVSNSVSYSVSARDYVGYKENCIYYYSDKQCHPYEDNRDILVMFNLEDATTRPLEQGDVFF